MTELRAKPGVGLCAAMKERRWPHVEATHPAENQNGIAVFSRTPLRRTRPCPAPSAGLVRWLDIDLPEFGLASAYTTSWRQGPAKSSGGSPIARAVSVRWRLEYGRATVGRNRKDIRMRGALRQVVDVGLDGYVGNSKLKGSARGNGFRLDHAFATPSLVERGSRITRW